ncbi:MAG: tetratricopeptide repeat protein [Chitinophagales bacterium]
MNYRNYIAYLFLFLVVHSFSSVNANVDSLLQVIEVQQKNVDDLGLIDSYQQLGLVYLADNRLQEALESYDMAMAKAETLGLKHQMANIYSNIADVYKTLKQPETAMNELKKALDVGETTISTIQKVEIFGKLSDLYLSMGNTDEAYDYQLRSLRYWEEENNKSRIANSYYQIASIYFAQQNFEEALVHYEKSLTIEKELKSEQQIVKSLAAIASVYGRMQQYDKSLQKNFEALKLAEEKNYVKGIAYASHNISADFLSIGKTKEARPYLYKALQLRREMGDKFGENTSLQAQGYMNMLLGNYDEGISSLEQALAIAQEINEKPLIRDSYLMLSRVYSKAEKWEKSFEMYRTYTAYKDSMMNDATNQKMTHLQINYEIQKKEKEKEIELLKKDKEIAALYRYGIIGCLVLMLSMVTLLLLFVFYRYKNQAAVNSILTDKNLKIQTQNAQLARSNRDLEQFAYIASHDLKEPLRNIGGFITLLNRKCGDYHDEEAKDYMQFITNSVDHMHHLLTDLLAYSRIGIVSREYEKIDLERVMSTVKNSFKSFIEEQNAEIVTSHLPTLYANRTQMVQLLQNLIGNALKFRKEDSPLINIDCVELPDRYVFSVQDNGIGMQQEYTEKIFVIFQRLHNRTEYEGTGIGLSICKKIVEQHHGEIWVESQSGKGSTFYFSISKNLGIETESLLSEQLAVGAY